MSAASKSMVARMTKRIEEIPSTPAAQKRQAADAGFLFAALAVVVSEVQDEFVAVHRMLATLAGAGAPATRALPKVIRKAQLQIYVGREWHSLECHFDLVNGADDFVKRAADSKRDSCDLHLRGSDGHLGLCGSEPMARLLQIEGLPFAMFADHAGDGDPQTIVEGTCDVFLGTSRHRLDFIVEFTLAQLKQFIRLSKQQDEALAADGEGAR
jgi:hypothetical protein